LGLSLLTLAQGDLPINTTNGYWSVLHSIRDDEPPKLKEGDQWSDEFKDFLSKCLVKDPDLRPTCQDLLSHPFVTEVVDEEEDEEPDSESSIEELRRILEAVLQHIHNLKLVPPTPYSSFRKAPTNEDDEFNPGASSSSLKNHNPPSDPLSIQVVNNVFDHQALVNKLSPPKSVTFTEDPNEIQNENENEDENEIQNENEDENEDDTVPRLNIDVNGSSSQMKDGYVEEEEKEEVDQKKVKKSKRKEGDDKNHKMKKKKKYDKMKEDDFYYDGGVSDGKKWMESNYYDHKEKEEEEETYLKSSDDKLFYSKADRGRKTSIDSRASTPPMCKSQTSMEKILFLDDYSSSDDEDEDGDEKERSIQEAKERFYKEQKKKKREEAMSKYEYHNSGDLHTIKSESKDLNHSSNGKLMLVIDDHQEDEEQQQEEEVSLSIPKLTLDVGGDGGELVGEERNTLSTTSSSSNSTSSNSYGHEDSNQGGGGVVRGILKQDKTAHPFLTDKYSVVDVVCQLFVQSEALESERMNHFLKQVNITQDTLFDVCREVVEEFEEEGESESGEEEEDGEEEEEDREEEEFEDDQKQHQMNESPKATNNNTNGIISDSTKNDPPSPIFKLKLPQQLLA